MDYQELFPVPMEWLQDVDRSMASTVAGWSEAEVMAGRLEHKEDYAALLEPAMRKLLGDIGLQAMLWPEGLGGGGLGTPDAAMTLVAVLEQVGRADTGIGFLLANTFALQSTFAIEPHRDDALLEEMAPSFVGDGVATGSLVLPYYSGASSAEYFGLPYQVSASGDGEGWTLSSKTARPQCSGANAAVFGVACEVDGSPALVLIPSGSKGLRAGEPFKKTGLAASLNADIVLENVKVPDSHMVLSGVERFRETLSWYYTLCSAVTAGALLAVWEILKEWGDTRVIKGKGQVFKENPLVASLMAEVGARIGSSRILTYNAARMISCPEVYGAAGSSAIAATAIVVFRQVTRMASEAMDNTMELMGSAGYATEWNLERYWRDVMTLESYVVPETVAQTDIARHYFDLKKL
jgi:alkylation response protein AidB-like acyl-CoA dehydrogenase